MTMTTQNTGVHMCLPAGMPIVLLGISSCLLGDLDSMSHQLARLSDSCMKQGIGISRYGVNALE